MDKIIKNTKLNYTKYVVPRYIMGNYLEAWKECMEKMHETSVTHLFSDAATLKFEETS